MRFLTLANKTDVALSDTLARAASAAGLTNVFNPSVAVHAGSTFIVFRAEPSAGFKPFHGYLLRVSPGGASELVDLGDDPQTSALSKLADPKLVRLGDALYVTFNTGNVHVGQNDIFLREVAPQLGPLQRCTFPGRRPVEKNWGFFLRPGEPLRVVYSLAPFSVLRLAAGELGRTAELRFEVEQSAALPGEFPQLHIGSQPLLTSSDRALVLANERVKIPPRNYRKMYVGRLAELDLRERRVARLSRTRLMHSWSAMLPPQLRRHNPVLWSATYFSGLADLQGDLIASYGLNDKSFGFARLGESTIWG